MNRISVGDAWAAWAPEWMQGLEGWLHEFFYNIFKCFVYDDRYTMLVDGLSNTLLLTFLSLLVGVVLGVVVSLVRVSWDKNKDSMHGIGKLLLGFANIISKIYLTVIRGTPVVVQILIFFFVVFVSSNNKVLVGCITFGINSGAYVAEIIRGGIMSVDNGQMEAGRSLGFGYVPTMWHIVIPQAFRTVLPSLANEFIVLLKETAVIGYVGLMDLTYAGNTISGTSFVYFYPLITVALIYLVMVMFFTWLVGILERRLRTGKKGKLPANNAKEKEAAANV